MPVVERLPGTRVRRLPPLREGVWLRAHCGLTIEVARMDWGQAGKVLVEGRLVPKEERQAAGVPEAKGFWQWVEIDSGKDE